LTLYKVKGRLCSQKSRKAMAENETCDIRCSQRWNQVIRAIRQQRSSVEVEREICKGLDGAWKAIQRQFAKHGHSLLQVVEAAIIGDRAYLDRVYRETDCHRFVKIIESCGGFMSTPADVVERAVGVHLRTV